MGWRWVEGGDSISSSSNGLGNLVNPNPSDSMEERYSTRRIVKSSCRTEEAEPGRFVRKCDKTEQILRESLGRPAEVVESKTEHTEDDVTDEVINGRHPVEPSGVAPFSFPGLDSDIEAIERIFFGGLGNFPEAAEEMAFLEAVKEMESPSFSKWLPGDGREKAGSEQREDEHPAYSGLAGEVTDV